MSGVFEFRRRECGTDAPKEQVFHKALARFRDIHIYANLVNDNTVPFPSAAIQMSDPFVKWKERGLQVKHDHQDLAHQWSFPQPDPLTVAKPKAKQWFNWNIGTLPPTLRFREPYSTVSYPRKRHRLTVRSFLFWLRS